MKSVFSFLFFLLAFAAFTQTVQSPSKTLALLFSLSENGRPTYEVFYKNKPIILKSELGLLLKDGSNLVSDFEIIDSKSHSFKENWMPVLGEQAIIENNYNEWIVMLQQKKTKRKMNVVFKVFNEGVAFRYDFPEQKELQYFVVSDEVTTFNLTGNHKTFWIPGDFDSNEYNYEETLFSNINTENADLKNGIGIKSIAGKYVVQSPLLLKTAENIYLSVFEAAVINYPVMHLDANPNQYKLTTHLVPNALGDKAYLKSPCVLPWRTLIISDDPRDIVGSKMILNLNEPSKITNTSWIKPMKYVGIWWEMHLGKSSWNYPATPPQKHGANTENTLKYIDFAAKNGFDAVLVEGWNVGWDDWYGKWKEEVFDFLTPYPDFNLEYLSKYAQSKGIKMIMHHETSGSVANYERHLDRAFDLMKKYNYPAVKTGYVGKIIPRGEFHDGQTMVNHYNFVVQRAADYQIMVNSHESVRPTGVHRTYPNYICSEAARGNEYNAWSSGNKPNLETILPFTRLLGGPMDYTPGIFEIKMNVYDPAKKQQIHTTLAKQLALYVTMYSPLQMAADLPENYEKYSDAFQFIKDVALDWEKTQYLEAEPGDYITVARKTKGKNEWFLGAITDENGRQANISCSFLDPNKKYKAIIYQDAADANWQTNPKAYRIKTIIVSSKSKIKVQLVPGGGAAMQFKEVK